ncbi:uncharacterized protein [Littorina saxatilis]|uniref:uncharacterized protein n=1 Tax=Littorina saxatilis TaxID=31220 RepID=UPI0038B4989A
MRESRQQRNVSVGDVVLEALDDLSTDSFISGLRCLIALRGVVRLVRYDRGTNFVGADNELKRAMKELDSKSITAKMLSAQCEFQFNPPSSSHMGGVWERQIRTVRNVLSGLLLQSSTSLNTSSFRTLLYEVMAIVNSRPLSTENLESSDCPLPLTPNHILTLKSDPILAPPGTFLSEDLYTSKRWRRVQLLADQFWKRWRKEYVATLQPRRVWSRQQRNVSVGDVVLLQDENASRADWKLGRVLDVYPSADGLVRSMQVSLASFDLDQRGRVQSRRVVLTRPVHRLCW